MPQAVSVAQMQQIDTAAIETFGIPRLLLMEHAGLALARAVQAHAPTPSNPILVCCGRGFNGGDGLAAARHLQAWGYALNIIVAAPPDQLRGEPATYARIIQRLGIPLLDFTAADATGQVERWLAASGLIIDALLGIGLRGDVREPLSSLIDRMNRSGKPIVAVDIPSGLDGDTGRIHGIAVRATVTVTFGLPKCGCLLNDGPAQTGSLIVDPITIPRALLEPSPP